MTGLVLAFGWIATGLLGVMAALFWLSPELGLRQTTHRRDLLPRVMADRYTAFAVLGAAIVIAGHLPLLAVFFGICAFMGLADGAIYARAGAPHWKHTASGLLAVAALAATLGAIATAP